MNTPNGLPSFGVASGGLEGFSCPGDATESQLDYQGMSVQAVGSSSSVRFGPSLADQNGAHPVNPLNEFRVTPLTQADPNGFDELDPPVISKSMFGEYVPWNPDKESVEDALFPVLGSCLYNQSLFLGNEPDISELTSANRFNPDHQLTDLPTELANPPSLRQATIDNPANSADIVDDKSSQVEHRRERKRERNRDYQRERYQNDPVYAERERERKRDYQRDYQRERYKNPDYLKRQRDYQRERRKNPDYLEHQRKCLRESQRERYQNDPSYAEGLKIYTKIYKKMKKNFSKEEASRLALLAKKQYLQSVNSAKDSGDLPQASKPTKTTRNSNKNSDVLPLPLSN